MKSIILAFILILPTWAYAKSTVTDYQRIFIPISTSKGELRIAIRVFKLNGTPSFLVVHPSTLETSILPIAHLQNPSSSGGTYANRSHWAIASTRYYQLLNKHTAAPYPLENKGVTHAKPPHTGNILTIDLCPSFKPFEKAFFQRLVQISNNKNKPIPITIAISGLWLLEHPDEFQWLLTQEKENKLSITWANHSFSHVFYKDLPHSKNFLISYGTNLELEILLTEKYLIEAGKLPSVFYRFPGLVSNKKIIKQLKAFGLIPLGADAWLAKHQKSQPGDIILVHGNSNEPEGIEAIMPMLENLQFMEINTSI